MNGAEPGRPAFGRLLAESSASGAALGLLAALLETGLVALVEPARAVELLRALPLASGAYAAAGSTLGAFCGSIFWLAPGLLEGGRPGPRAAFLTGVARALLLLGAWLQDLGALELGVAGTLGSVVALAAALLVAWRLRELGERPLAWLLTSRFSSPLLAGFAAAAVAYAVPWLLLREPFGAVTDFWLRLACLLAAASASGLVLFGLFAAAGATSRRLRTGAVVYAAGACALSLAVALAPGLHGPKPPGPNVLLIVIDTLRADHLPMYGYARDTSPHLAALAEQGALFEDAVSTASFTMPSVASLLTGRLPHEHGVREHPSRLPEGESTLAEQFHRGGYATGAVLSHPLLSRRWGFAQGFGFYDAPDGSPFEATGGLHPLRALERDGRPWSAETTTRSAIRWLRRHQRDPFFLWVHYIDPHFPYDPPLPYDALFSRTDTGPYDDLLQSYRDGALDIDAIALSASLEPAVVRGGEARYDGEIAYTDRELQRLLDALADLGLLDGTLVVVTADHGEAFGEHGVSFEHAFNTFEELMRVPLLFAWPSRIAPGRRIASQVSLLDVGPTLLELAGLAAPEGMRGRSLAPLLLDEPVAWDPAPAYGENQALLPGHPTYAGMSRYPWIYRSGNEGKWRMVRLPPWKLIHVPGRPEGENLLFHLTSDPGELSDRAASRPDVVRKLEAHLAEWVAEDRGAAGRAGPTLRPEDLENLRALGYAAPE